MHDVVVKVSDYYPTPYRKVSTGVANKLKEYSIERSVGADVHMRTHLAVPASSHVWGSFIHQITEDFIIPLNYITLLSKIGEGRQLQ